VPQDVAITSLLICVVGLGTDVFSVSTIMFKQPCLDVHWLYNLRLVISDMLMAPLTREIELWWGDISCSLNVL
jgi:hypothetical protein